MDNPYDAPELVQARKEQEDPWVMYLIVHESLGMSGGKTAAQTGHAVGMLFQQFYGVKLKQLNPDVNFYRDNDFEHWLRDSYRKIVLKASDKEWNKLKTELPRYTTMVMVRDAGLTEIEPGSETVIGVWPMKKSEAPKMIKRLQVLK